MKLFLIGCGAIVLAVMISFAAGVRILVVKPIGAVPDGRTLILTGVPGLNYIDSPDAFCLRTTGQVTLLCRGAGLAGIINRSTIVARLPYSSVLDSMAGTPVTER